MFKLNTYKITYLNYWDESNSITRHARSKGDAREKAMQDVDVIEIIAIVQTGR